MNLFIELHEARFGTTERRFGAGWENLFTELFGFFLAADLSAATALARLFFGGREVVVTVVTTQPSLAQGIADLRIEFADGTHLHVENKFDAPLGHQQLQRYLGDGRLALVSRCNQSVAPEVFGCSDYLHPVDRDYFNWADVYEALPPATEAPRGFGALRDHFRGYMRELGLAPSALTSEWRRLFEDRTDAQNQMVQRDFGRLLDPVKSALRSRGLRVGDVSHKGKQAYAPSGAWWRHLYVTPSRVRADYLDASDAVAFDPGYEGLVVELVCDSAARESAWAVFKAVCAGFTDSQGHTWCAVKPQPIGRDRLRVALAAPLPPFLKHESGLSTILSASALEALEQLLTAETGVTHSSAPPNNALPTART